MTIGGCGESEDDSSESLSESSNESSVLCGFSLRSGVSGT